jgi:cytochrome c
MSAVTAIRAALAVVVVASTVSCKKHVTKAPTVAGGNAERGRLAIQRYGCGSCHTISGIASARGLVGPPLQDVGQRMYIAGVLPNQPENIVRWIMDPPATDAKTAMPKLGVIERDARDIAEYLYSQR